MYAKLVYGLWLPDCSDRIVEVVLWDVSDASVGRAERPLLRSSNGVVIVIGVF